MPEVPDADDRPPCAGASEANSIREMIRHEDDLKNHRMTWFLTVQGSQPLRRSLALAVEWHPTVVPSERLELPISSVPNGSSPRVCAGDSSPVSFAEVVSSGDSGNVEASRALLKGWTS